MFSLWKLSYNHCENRGPEDLGLLWLLPYQNIANHHIPAYKQSRKPSVVGHSLYSTTFVFLVRLVDTFPNSSNPSYENNKTHSLIWHLTNSFTSQGI